MQKDFHFGTTYTLSRLAGFSKEESEIIATSSQFIDDAIHSGKIVFNNRAGYQFFASAHKMLDYRNYEELANHYSWIPFHFIPGNVTDDPLFKGVEPFVQKLICQPNSLVARLMVKKTIENKHKHYSLYQLGIAMHAYADTWAHQKFCGISHPVNNVQEILNSDNELHEYHHRSRKYYKRSLWKRFLSWLVGEVSPLGHGPALSMPDKPFAKWQYINFKGDKVTRDNTSIFLDACDHLYNTLCQFKNDSTDLYKIPQEDRLKIQKCFETFTSENEEERNNNWINEIASGSFSFGAEVAVYKGLGEDSWYDQLNIDLEQELESVNKDVEYTDKFLTSHWKLFHDALVEHRKIVLHEVLPQFQITVV